QRSNSRCSRRSRASGRPCTPVVAAWRTLAKRLAELTRLLLGGSQIDASGLWYADLPRAVQSGVRVRANTALGSPRATSFWRRRALPVSARRLQRAGSGSVLHRQLCGTSTREARLNDDGIGPLLLHCRKSGLELLDAMDHYCVDNHPCGCAA